MRKNFCMLIFSHDQQLSTLNYSQYQSQYTYLTQHGQFSFFIFFDKYCLIYELYELILSKLKMSTFFALKFLGILIFKVLVNRSVTAYLRSLFVEKISISLCCNYNLINLF